MLFFPSSRGLVSPALRCGLAAACVSAAGWPALAWSQSPPPAAAPAVAMQAGRAPWDASAPVPPAHYRSTLSTSPTAMPPPTAWAEANATVGRIGGWRAYLREVQGATPSPGAATAISTSSPTSAAAPAAPHVTPPVTPPTAPAHSHGHAHGQGG